MGIVMMSGEDEVEDSSREVKVVLLSTTFKQTAHLIKCVSCDWPPSKCSADF